MYILWDEKKEEWVLQETAPAGLPRWLLNLSDEGDVKRLLELLNEYEADAYLPLPEKERSRVIAWRVRGGGNNE